MVGVIRPQREMLWPLLLTVSPIYFIRVKIKEKNLHLKQCHFFKGTIPAPISKKANSFCHLFFKQLNILLLQSQQTNAGEFLALIFYLTFENYSSHILSLDLLEGFMRT